MKPSRLDFRHLQMISILAETPRVTDAAERLGITPSALSHRIREAERRLDVPLFTRVRKRLRMTPAAEHLAHVAGRLLADLARAEADARLMGGDVRHVVRLAVESYSSYHWLPAFLHHLRIQAPEIRVQVVAAAARNPLDSLSDQTVDLAVISGARALDSTEAVHLFDDELLFIMAPDHRLAARPFIEGRDVVDEDFITFGRVPEPDREYARLFRPNETYPRWRETIELPEAIVDLVAAGLGTSVLAGWAVRDAIDRGRIVGVRISPEGLSIPWFAATRGGDAAGEHGNRRVARILADWCGTSEGFRTLER